VKVGRWEGGKVESNYLRTFIPSTFALSSEARVLKLDIFHKGTVRVGSFGCAGFEDEVAAVGAKVEHLEHGDEEDAEESRCVGSHEAGFDYADGHEDEREHGAPETNVKAEVEEIFLILQKLKFD
jgi:hypothetical protein